MINSKLNKQYKNEDSGDRKELEDIFSEIMSKKSSNNNLAILKRSKTNNNNFNENIKYATPSKNSEYKKSTASLGIRKQYNEDE